MKKFVALFLIIFIFSLCSCTTATSSYKSELISSSWHTTLEGGAEVSLTFDDEIAALDISSTDKSCKIEGKYIADEQTLVIFVPKIAQNYGFSYTPKNSTLTLSFEGNSITLEKCDEP